MREIIHKKLIRNVVKLRAKIAGKKHYPAGKALGRIQYFEEKRSLPQTTVVDGLVRQSGETKPRVLKRASRKRTTSKATGYLAALKKRQQAAPAFMETENLPVWRPLGPNLIPEGQTYGTGGNDSPSVSGRCVGIMVSAINPMHLVVCSANGGLWGSFDSGTTWQPLTDGQPTVSMGAIAVAPSSPNIVYAGTGEGDTFSQLGVGLLRSNDGGLTWTLVASNDLAGFGIYDIAVDPSDPFHLWVGTTRKLFESKNGGDSWQVIQELRAWSISIHPNNSDEIYVATNAGLIVSTNGGVNWARVALSGAPTGTDFERIEVCHAPSKPAVVYATAVTNDPFTQQQQGRFWRKATNNGNFSSQKLPALLPNSDLRQAWYDWCFGVSPDDPDEVFWGAVHLYRGRRGSNGFRWSNISSRSSGDSIHPDQHHIAFSPDDPSVVYICNDGGVFRSPNRGTNWESLNPGLDITEFEYIAQLESDDGWLIGGTQDNGTLAYEQGREWDQIALGDGGDCGADDAGGLCYHSYFGMWIERARTHGPFAFRWSNVSPPFDPDTYPALFYPPLEVNEEVVAKAGNTLFVSDDEGGTWSEIPFGNGSELASAMAIPRKNIIIVGTNDGNVYRIQRGTNGWDQATSTPLTSPRQAYLSDFYIPGSPNSNIWVSSSAFGGAHVFHSTDGGVTWANRTSSLPDIPVNAVVGDPSDDARIFLATDHGVYETSDAGSSWRDFSVGLPNVLIGDLLLHQQSRLLRAGTRSRGVWEVDI